MSGTETSKPAFPILRCDPERAFKDESDHERRGTGIYFRAMRGKSWDSVDMLELDRESLHALIQYSGPEWTATVLMLLLGHERSQ